MPAKPTIEQLRAIAHMYNLHMSDADLESFRGLMSATFESYRRIDQLPEPALSVHYARTGGYRPTAEENPLNAWYQKCSIKGAASGPLAGKRIAIKDNVCVAGVPMMNGSVVLEGYVPECDATIVTRILDAGGEIVGKAVCEVSASQAVASPPIQVRCITHTIPPTRQVVPLVGVQGWLWRVSAIWRSVVTRAARLAFRVPGAAHMVSNPPMAWSPILASSQSS